MAQLGKYEIPAEYKDEDRWWKFTKRQLVYVAVCIGLDVLFFRMFQSLGLTAVWIVLDILITVFLAVIAFTAIPKSNYLHGGGMMLEAILLRVILRKMHRVLYVKNYDRKENC